MNEEMKAEPLQRAIEPVGKEMTDAIGHDMQVESYKVLCEIRDLLQVMAGK